MQMFVRMLYTAIVGVGVAVRGGYAAITLLDASELPHGDGATPGEQEQADYDVSELSKVEQRDGVIKATVKT